MVTAHSIGMLVTNQGRADFDMLSFWPAAVLPELGPWPNRWSIFGYYLISQPWPAPAVVLLIELCGTNP